MKWLEKSVLGLMTGSVSMFIAACYGTGDDLDGSGMASGTVVNKHTGESIANILVKCLGRDGNTIDETYTQAGDGSYTLLPNEETCTSLVFEDVDGTDNGGAFQTKQIGFVEGEQPTVALEPVAE